MHLGCFPVTFCRSGALAFPTARGFISWDSIREGRWVPRFTKAGFEHVQLFRAEGGAFGTLTKGCVHPLSPGRRCCGTAIPAHASLRP